MGNGSFAEKFEEALNEKRQADKNYGLRTLAREISGGDPKRTETVRRQLHKYRPKPGGGAAEITPTEPTRHEIERALGLDVDALEPEKDLLAALNESLFTVKVNEDVLRRLIAEQVQVLA